MRYLFRLFTSFLVALCVTLPVSAINTPLSDEAVREAYFLGQRHDGSYPSLMGNYIKRPPAPKSGPHIFSITFLTPFIQLVANSDRFIGNYSAQQAALDHRGQAEFVRIIVEIKLTPPTEPSLLLNQVHVQVHSQSPSLDPMISGGTFKSRSRTETSS